MKEKITVLYSEYLNLPLEPTNELNIDAIVKSMLKKAKTTSMLKTKGEKKSKQKKTSRPVYASKTPYTTRRSH
jgi:hypothetical protein